VDICCLLRLYGSLLLWTFGSEAATLQETLRVKDEELQNLSRDLRARDSTIKDIAEKLSETAEAAEAAASAAYTMDEHRRIACAEIERLYKDSEKQQELFTQKVCHFSGLGLILSKLLGTINP